jgi:DNA helicase II / ATP-dependent DNA helicase PcrA
MRSPDAHGRSKGLGFDSIVIYPTKDMVEWLRDPTYALRSETRAKFYVALTRARHTVAVVFDLPGGDEIPGFNLFC